VIAHTLATPLPQPTSDRGRAKPHTTADAKRLWELQHGKFRCFEHPLHLTREKALEGKYVIQTEEQNLSALEVVARYKELNEVERGFAHLKGLLELRPIYHHSDERVQAHVFVAALALLLDRALEKQLRACR
jgi:transposase